MPWRMRGSRLLLWLKEAEEGALEMDTAEMDGLLASAIAAPCSSILDFDIARLFQNVESFGLREMACVYSSIEAVKSLSMIPLVS
jgi:hypothetical protein